VRTAFIDTLNDLAGRDERIWLLCGDLGFSVLESFAHNFPRRYVNVGVAEQNMTGVAAGLALSGKIVFTYSIANFPVMRCLEQVRNDVCYHRLSVKIVSVGGGFAYGPAGYTHHGIEDLAVMRVLPNMTVLAPGDPIETKLLTIAAVERSGPCYLRLGKAGEASVHTSQPDVQIGKAIVVRNGNDGTLISTGATLGLVVKAAADLSARGVSVSVLSMPSLSPLDKDAILTAARDTGRIVTVEDHGLGGLGSAVAEVLAASTTGSRFSAVYLQAQPAVVAGSQATLYAAHGITTAEVVTRMMSLLETEAGSGKTNPR
jgi:transketolase